MVQFGNSKSGIAQSIAAMNVPRIGGWNVLIVRGSQARKTRRIELFDNDLRVPTGLGGRNVASGRGYGYDFQTRIEQRQTKGNGIVNTGITVDDYLPGHCNVAGLDRFVMCEWRSFKFSRIW